MSWSASRVCFLCRFPECAAVWRYVLYLDRIWVTSSSQGQVGIGRRFKQFHIALINSSFFRGKYFLELSKVRFFPLISYFLVVVD